MKIINYNGEYFTSLKDICSEFDIEYDVEVVKAGERLKNKLGDILEYIFVGDEYWISYCGLYMLFKDNEKYRAMSIAFLDKIKESN